MALSLPHTLQALLFTAGESLPKKRILTLLTIPADMLDAAITDLRESLTDTGLSLIETEDELELRTSPDASVVMEKFHQSELSRDLGKAGLEALAIILYQNGATRSDVDWVRGVNSTAAIRSLLMRGLVERTMDTTDKRRARYTTTVDALAHLGISRREDLPNFTELSTALASRQASNADAAVSLESSAASV